jgi:hypothetical protein
MDSEEYKLRCIERFQPREQSSGAFIRDYRQTSKSFTTT